MSLDRDAARAVIRQATGWAIYDTTLDALEECVRPAPAQTIDRAALVSALRAWLETRPEETFDQGADRILALLRPGDGVTLSRDEARFALHGVAAITDIDNRYVLSPKQEQGYAVLKRKLQAAL